MTKANIMTAYDTGTYTNFSKVERTMPDQMPEPTSFVTLYTLFVEDPDDTGDYGYWDESEEIVDNPGTFVETLEELDDLLKTIPRRYAVTVLELRRHSVMPVYTAATLQNSAKPGCDRLQPYPTSTQRDSPVVNDR
jgi:hypothetical protein